MLERDFTYLAVPYSHEDPEVREERFRRVNEAAAYLFRQGHVVYSPISHCHPIAMAGELPKGWAFWRNIDRVYLRHCRRVVVLTLKGWTDSTGVQDEIAMAQEMDIPEDDVKFEPLED